MPLTLEQLSAAIGTFFTVHTSAGPLQLELVEAAERPRGGLPERFATPLSLVLRGPAGVALTQDNYRMEHPALGDALWMLVPVVAHDGAQPGRYEVILSQMRA